MEHISLFSCNVSKMYPWPIMTQHDPSPSVFISEHPFYFGEEQTPMFQCSMCTGGCALCSLDPDNKCTTCRKNTPHICQRCIIQASGVMPTTCYLCTPRGHICLSRCSGGCILRERPKCQCGHPIRLQVQKQNNNHGRYFWSCRDCNFFEWESWCTYTMTYRTPRRSTICWSDVRKAGSVSDCPVVALSIV